MAVDITLGWKEYRFQAWEMQNIQHTANTLVIRDKQRGE